MRRDVASRALPFGGKGCASGTSRSTPPPYPCWKNTSMPPDTVPTSKAHCFGLFEILGGTLERPLTGTAVYTNIVKHHAVAAKIPTSTIRPHCLRATAATNALEHGADIAKVRDWLGHAVVSTTQLY